MPDNEQPRWIQLYVWRQPDGRFGFSREEPVWASTYSGGPKWAIPRTKKAEDEKEDEEKELLFDGMFHLNVCLAFVQWAFGDVVANIPSGVTLPIELAARMREGGD
jgi:hypothetical protein